MKLQDQICEFLRKSNCNIGLNGKVGPHMLELFGKNFLIGDEANYSNKSSERYFKIFYKEVRTDQLFVQVTPRICFRDGFLKIDKDGKITLTDDKFKSYRSSINFYFDQGIIKTSRNDAIEGEERLSSKCVKGLLTVGMFAMAATAAYYAYTEDNTNSIKLTL